MIALQLTPKSPGRRPGAPVHDMRLRDVGRKRSRLKVAPLVVGLQSQPDIRALRHSTVLVWTNARSSVAVGAHRGALAVVLIVGEPAGPLMTGRAALKRRRLIGLRLRLSLLGARGPLRGSLRQRRRGDKGGERHRGKKRLHSCSPIRSKSPAAR